MPSVLGAVYTHWIADVKPTTKRTVPTEQRDSYRRVENTRQVIAVKLFHLDACVLWGGPDFSRKKFPAEGRVRTP